ncbi:MAG: N-6 DNA methylase, partial [Bacilli bacterium]
TYRRFVDENIPAGMMEEKYAYVASLDEIRENDFNLNIPRYVDTFEEEAEIDIQAIQREIEELETELKAVQAKMNDYLNELELL